MNKAIAIIGISVMFLSSIPEASFAQKTTYADVQAGAYYEDAAAALLLNGALDSSETLFRPDNIATRAEVMKLLVKAYGTALVNPPTPSFSDVPRTAWYYTYIETAAHAGWMRGDRNCYGTNTANCTARPASSVNRAEMAIILERAFNLSNLGIAPIFRDNVDTRTWYHVPIQVAADHCILQGDGMTGLVRPASSMNRAEMIVMVHRAQQQERYGQDCTVPGGQIQDISTPTTRRVYVSFNTDLDPNRIDEIERYAVKELDGSGIGIVDATVINTRTIELLLASDLNSGTSYRLHVTSMRTENGAVFNNSKAFVFTPGENENATLEDVVPITSTKVRLIFTANLNESRAEDESHYSMTHVNTSGTVSIDTATLVSSRTVDIVLATDLATNASYRISASNLITDTGLVFSDSAVFSNPSASPSGHIQSVTVDTSTKVRVMFDTELDEVRAEQTDRYSISTPSYSLNVSAANLLEDDRTVELNLSQALTSQTPYTVNAITLLSTDNVIFTDNDVFVYDASPVLFSAFLRGNQEVPTVSTAMSGTGSFTLNSSGLQYTVTLQNLSGSITGAHFHRADMGVNGSVVKAISFSGNTSTGTWSLTNEQRTALLAGDIYVNVHTAAHPDGEVRGQLIRQ